MRKLGTGQEFADYRPYSPGDDFRMIDWNVRARLGSLILRLFEEDEDVYVYLLVDASASMSEGKKFDHARRIAAALAYLGLSNIDRVSVSVFRDRLSILTPPGSGKGKMNSIMALLEKETPSGSSDLLETVKELSNRTSRRGLVVLISDFMDCGDVDEAAKFLRYGGYDAFAAHVFSSFEENPAVTGEFVLIDNESGEKLSASIDDELLADYGKVFREFVDRLIRTFRKYNQTLVPCPVSLPFEGAVTEVLSKGFFVAR